MSGCSTFFFDSREMLDRAEKTLADDGIACARMEPCEADEAMHVWALSVRGKGAARAKELLMTGDLAVVGHYDLPQAERPLPENAGADTPLQAEEPFVDKMWMAFAAQCFADPSKIRIIAHHDRDVAHLMPYLNAIIKTAQYNPGGPTLFFKEGVRMITLYPTKIAIAKADDLHDAWLYLKQIKDRIDYVSNRTDEITPDHSKSEPPSALDIYKLLPRTNCGRCGMPTCLSFAAEVVGGSTEPDECPELREAENAERRFRLFELLGQAP